jgi:predicted Zn-dependent protease
VINAAVLGALPRFRYVLVTDALLTTLDEDEIEAVFAHEAGHARRGHVLLFLGFTSVLGFIGFVPGIADFLLSPLAAFPLLRLIVLLGVWLGVVFGWISRRFEQEADVFGLETLPTPGGSADPADHPFARAMERIGGEVGAIREVTGWRHFSIADRVAFVRSYLTDENVRRAYRRSILLLRGSLLLVIGGFALSAALQVPSEVLSAVATWRAGSEAESKVLVGVNLVRADPVPQRRGEVLWRTAGHALLANRGDDALRWLRESVALDPRNEDALAAYANLLERTGRPAGARLVWEELAAREDLAPERRDAARRRAAASGSR